MVNQVLEPKGISFFSIKSGETHYCKLEPTIAAYINSSDMGINASRGQDYGWRLDPEWVKRVRAFRRDRTQMAILTAKNEGRKPNTVQILYYMYGEELADYYEAQEEQENPFEEAYLQAIASGKTVKEAAEQAGMPKALADFRATIENEGDDEPPTTPPVAAAPAPLPDTTPPAAPVVPESPLTEPLAPREEDDDAELDAAAEAATSDMQAEDNQPPPTAVN